MYVLSGAAQWTSSERQFVRALSSYGALRGFVTHLWSGRCVLMRASPLCRYSEKMERLKQLQQEKEQLQQR